MFEIEKIYGPGDRISLTGSTYTICQHASNTQHNVSEKSDMVSSVTHVTLANQHAGR